MQEQDFDKFEFRHFDLWRPGSSNFRLQIINSLLPASFYQMDTSRKV